MVVDAKDEVLTYFLKEKNRHHYQRIKSLCPQLHDTSNKTIIKHTPVHLFSVG